MMFQLELLPRLLPDAYFDHFQEAVAEAEQRMVSPVSGDAVTRIVESRYGDHQVITVSQSVAMELLIGQFESDVVDPRMLPRVG